MDNAIEMKQIKKAFGNNQVLKSVDFTLKKGSIHALLGENGTGKSTLMNILTGLLSYDDGQIKIENGYQIAFIHQELSLVNDLNIYENLFLGRELRKGLLLDRKLMMEKAAEVLTSIKVDLKPETLVANLSASQKQLVEICHALLQESKVIIMDEPTSSLSDVEIENLFQVMRKLKAKGISIIFISHKLGEVLEICDEYTIMRNGQVVAKGAVTPDLTKEEISLMMVGKQLAAFKHEDNKQVGPVILEVSNLTKEKQYSQINLKVKQGEIIGITGLMGDGRSELFASVAGANYPYSGQIRLAGKELNLRTTTQAVAAGIAYLPKNRKENAVIADLDISDNMLVTVLNRLRGRLLLNKNQEQAEFERYCQQFNIKYGDKNDLITTLSGGNQQKVILARALTTRPKVVILDNPTQGVDIGARTEIYQQLQELARQQVSLIILSNEFDEIYKNCDRVYVMYQGRIQKELGHDQLTEAKVLYYAMGGQDKDKEESKHGKTN
ncbi:sugar ABC transporter ATP-binding protein [Ligilactobacillus agilis]|uniref:sugar ABC transporter ATP-binding protein n=1 Tax=Ligilactobacillus agilis TaxID=1601 RepID=UPI00255C55D1|nr:sugar ABC transporter ATP-binding protein [Ligilactobacillus agilis]